MLFIISCAEGNTPHPVMSNAVMLPLCGPRAQSSSRWEMWGSGKAAVKSLTTYPFAYSYMKTHSTSKPQIQKNGRMGQTIHHEYFVSNLCTCKALAHWIYSILTNGGST